MQKWSAIAPTGYVTFAFIDVYQLDSLVGAYGDDVAPLLKAYHETVEAILMECSGYECGVQGDAYMMAFSSSVEAVNCCNRLHVKMLSTPTFRSPYLPEVKGEGQGDARGTVGHGYLYRGLQLCIGLHCGKPFFETDPVTSVVAYSGPVVDLAARMGSLAAPGQTLLTHNVYKEVSPYTWPQDDNPLMEEPTFAHLGWFDLPCIGTHPMATAQVFEVRPMQLVTRRFDLISENTRTKEKYKCFLASNKDMIHKGEGKAAAFESDANLVRAMKAQIKILKEDALNLSNEKAEYDELIGCLEDEIEELKEVCQRKDNELTLLNEEFSEKLEEKALEGNAGTEVEGLRATVSILAAELGEERQTVANQVVGQELPLYTNNSCCVVLTDLQQSLSAIYNHVLKGIIPNSTVDIDTTWTDNVRHEGAQFCAHLTFSSPEEALKIASQLRTTTILGSPPHIILSNNHRQSIASPTRASIASRKVSFASLSSRRSSATSRRNLSRSVSTHGNVRALVEMGVLKSQNAKVQQLLKKFTQVAGQYFVLGTSIISKQATQEEGSECDSEDCDVDEDPEAVLNRLDGEADLWTAEVLPSLEDDTTFGAVWTPLIKTLLVLLTTARRYLQMSFAITRDPTCVTQLEVGGIENLGLVSTAHKGVQVSLSSVKVSTQTDTAKQFHLPTRPPVLYKGSNVNNKRAPRRELQSVLCPSRTSSKASSRSFAALQALQTRHREADNGSQPLTFNSDDAMFRDSIFPSLACR